MLRNSGQHRRADFFVVVEAEHIVPIVGMMQLDVRTLLGRHSPTLAEKRALDDFRLRTAPLGQAEIGRILMESGMFLDFSTSSAIA